MKLTAALLVVFATPALGQSFVSSPYPAAGGVVVYSQTAYGPITSGANTTSLLGASAAYGFGSSGGLPILRCDYAGQQYVASLTGVFSLATTTPGPVDANMILGGTTITTRINNLVAGTPGASWDANAVITCATVGTNTATVLVGGELGPFQAVGNVYAFQPFNRSGGPKTITTNGGAFTFDLSRTFTNANNTMQVETMSIVWAR